MRNDVQYMTKAAVIAALYVVLILIQLPMGELAFGPVQLRLAEGLAILPMLEAAAVPGLFLGCVIGNIILMGVSGYGLVDVVCGSLITLLAAHMTSKTKKFRLAILPPVILNGLLVPAYLSPMLGIPYLPTALSIGAGELASVGIFGFVVYKTYQRAKPFIDRRNGYGAGV